MANRSDRGREQPAVMSRALKPAKQNGTSSAETIRASGHDRANRPHTRLHPDQACQTLTDPLQCGSHPHKTFRFRPGSVGRSTRASSAGGRWRYGYDDLGSYRFLYKAETMIGTIMPTMPQVPQAAWTCYG